MWITKQINSRQPPSNAITTQLQSNNTISKSPHHVVVVIILSEIVPILNRETAATWWRFLQCYNKSISYFYSYKTKSNSYENYV